jgi:two-component system, chemotaxis family, protein-glutamate methylesterase/glutaminase
VANKKVLIVDRAETSIKLSSWIDKLKLPVDVEQTSCFLEARRFIVDTKPDIIFLGAELEDGRGSFFLKKIMTHLPVPIVMLKDAPSDEFKMQCFVTGAIDVLDRSELRRYGDELAERLKLNIIEARERMEQKSLIGKWNVSGARKTPRKRRFNVIAIGSSTGGTEALAAIVKDLPSGLPPIVIAQHMPPEFTASFAQRLNGLGPLRVKEAAAGDILEKGWAYVAPGRNHMQLRRLQTQTKIEILSDLGEHKYSPSVDVLFDSVAKYYASSAVGFLLTGMGRDGAKGMLNMRSRGAHTINQDEASSAIYGMPKEAKLLGASELELPLDKMAQYIVQLFDE